MPNNEELVLEMVSAIMDGLRESFITDVLKGMRRGEEMLQFHQETRQF